ncbi:hypothetical protein Tco_0830119 [Tanacetum coccineum]
MTTNGAPSSSTGQCKVANADHDMLNVPISSSKLNNLHKVYFLSDSDSQGNFTWDSNNGPSYPPGTPSLKSLKTNNLQDRQEQQVKNKLRLDEYIPVKHFCKPIVQTYNGKMRMWPTCNPDKSICDRGVEIYRRTRAKNLRIWYCNHDSERKNMKKVGLSFPDYLLVRYGGRQLNDLIWGQSYADWYKENSHDNKPRPRDYTFREWMIVKVGHTNVKESVNKALLKSWVINCFKEALDPDKDPMEKRFDDYKWVFDLEIEQLADEYELGIGKKGHILDIIWKNCKNIQDHGFIGYPIDYHVTLGFGSIVGGLDHVNPVIRLPLEHWISRVLGKVDHSNPSVGTNPVTASIT